MSYRRSLRTRAIYAETIDGLSLLAWCDLIQIVLERWDELANMDSTEDMLRRIGWDAKATRLTTVQRRHLRLVFATINATRRHDSRPGRDSDGR